MQKTYNEMMETVHTFLGRGTLTQRTVKFFFSNLKKAQQLGIAEHMAKELSEKITANDEEKIMEDAKSILDHIWDPTKSFTIIPEPKPEPDNLEFKAIDVPPGMEIYPFNEGLQALGKTIVFKDKDDVLHFDSEIIGKFEITMEAMNIIKQMDRWDDYYDKEPISREHLWVYIAESIETTNSHMDIKKDENGDWMEDEDGNYIRTELTRINMEYLLECETDISKYMA